MNMNFEENKANKLNYQTTKNEVYQYYEEISKVIEDEDDNGRKRKGNKKIIGAITAGVFKNKFNEVLENQRLNNEIYVSENNVFIKGCDVEFDFLVLKKNAKKIRELPLYHVDDVVAILESKTYGVYSTYQPDGDELQNEKKTTQLEHFNLYRLVEAYDALFVKNNRMTLGYMTLSEKIPVNDNAKSNFIRYTERFFKDAFSHFKNIQNAEYFTYYSKAFIDSKKIDSLFSSDEDWVNFVMGVVKAHKSTK